MSSHHPLVILSARQLRRVNSVRRAALPERDRSVFPLRLCAGLQRHRIGSSTLTDATLETIMTDLLDRYHDCGGTA